jgi:hypothetical protein
MSVIYLLGTIGAVLAFIAVRIAARQDQRDFQREQGITHPKTERWKDDSDNYHMQWLYGGVAVVACLPLFLGLMSAVLHADVPISDPCGLLEPYSWQWWLLGCAWGS